MPARKKPTQSTDREQTKYFAKINKELYKRNFELAVRNQTLLTLRKLYELANATMATEALAERLVFTLTEDLHLEMSAIFFLSEDQKQLHRTVFVNSTRMDKIVASYDRPYKDLSIPLSRKTNPLVQAFSSKQTKFSDTFSSLYEGLVTKSISKKIQTEARIKTTVIYPLVTENRKIGVLLLAMNRTYKDLTNFEKEAIDSFVEVLAVSLDKALVYDELRIANQKLRELDVAKSEFMSIASHQLRTPLAGVIGYLSMLVEGDYGAMQPDQAKVINEIYQASQRLVRLVNTFLNVTRIEAGRFTMNFTQNNLVDVVSAEVKELQPTADKKGIQLIYQAPPQVMTAAVDADKIRDVFLNLIDNAIKYTQEGSVSVFVETTPSEHAKADKVHFFVKDTGVGIDPHDAEHLFQKFVRGSGIARVQPNGSGLGLFIVKKIVEAHNGRVWVSSDGVGQGTTFHVELPMQQPIVPVKK